NRSRSRAQRFSLSLLRMGERGLDVAHIQPLPDNLPKTYNALARSGRALTRHALAGGHRVDVLVNGEQAYPAMLQAIDSARDHTVLTTYIVDTDETGLRFIDALGRAVERGVTVRVLIDGVGEWYSWPRASSLLRRAGVDTARFLPPRLIPPSVS